jgi:hypothetical protein
MSHGQIVLRPECRGVGLVRGWSDGVRDGSATAPATPDVPHPCATAPRGSCGNLVTRTGRPGKRLRRSIWSAINRE